MLGLLGRVREGQAVFLLVWFGCALRQVEFHVDDWPAWASIEDQNQNHGFRRF